MKFKGIEIKGNFEVREKIGFFEVWQNGNMIYWENTNGGIYWLKREFDDKGRFNYFRDSDGYWWRREFDEKGCVIYYEKSNGKIVDHRPKTKMVFRLWKFLEDKDLTSEDKARTILNGWVQECEGKTQEEGIELNRGFSLNWLVEEEN